MVDAIILGFSSFHRFIGRLKGETVGLCTAALRVLTGQPVKDGYEDHEANVKENYHSHILPKEFDSFNHHMPNPMHLHNQEEEDDNSLSLL